jgi:eukaryotic-like serine/threonine-protein kinase
MALTTGTKFGRYEIRSQLGVGGMGEVYRARDCRLNRDVAIKVLLDSRLRDPERMARFEREAQVLASLNHPNIAAIYGLEETNGVGAQVGLIMELVEGPTLADRVRSGPISFDEALPIAKQIVDALEVAHERSIIHRDLKPANIKVTQDGVVKILDFGLAKVFSSDTPPSDLSHSPTLLKGTDVGVILGTAAYMSPEQAKGKVVDKRSDVWAFGCVLFEMLSGKQPFVGETLTDTLAAVVRGEPDWDQLPPTIPGSVKRLIQRCLEKDPKRRLRDIGDARFELDESAIKESSPTSIGSQKTSRSFFAIAAVAALVGVVALASVLVTRWFTPKTAPLSVVRAVEELPSDQIPSGDARTRLAISPDGKNLIYVAKQRLYVRPLDSVEAVPIAGTESGVNPFFSPDGKWLGFWSSGQLKKVPIAGGNPVSICSTEMIGASWGPDDTILIGGIYGGILRVPASGGTPVRVVEPQPSLAYHYPQFLPDGRSFLYDRGVPGNFARNQLVMRSLDKDDETVVLEGTYNFTYLKSGILIYTVGSNNQSVDLQAVAFDPSTRKSSGTPITIAKNIALTTAGSGAQFAVSGTGTLAYLPASASGSRSHLVRVSQTGQVEVLPAEPRLYSDPRVSPDGHFVASHLQGDENDVWVVGVERGSLTRLSFSPSEDETPAWSPDGRTVAWAGSRTNLIRGIFRRPADGGGNEELVWSLNLHAHVRDWTPDSKALIIETADPKTNNDIWRLDLEGQPTATPIIQTPFNEHNSRLSPDGHWLAYSSNESGRDEIYIQPYPQGGSRLTVTTSGGDQPVWARDGRTLFFRSNGGVCAIDFVAGVQPKVSNVRVLFPDRFDNPQAGNHTGYDVFPDGRLLMLQSSTDPESTRTKIVMVFNWLEELKQLQR